MKATVGKGSSRGKLLVRHEALVGFRVALASENLHRERRAPAVAVKAPGGKLSHMDAANEHTERLIGIVAA
jgi:hypothetical protein